MGAEDRTVLIRSQREERPLLAERYRLLERIGSGGVADVWRALDERLDREIAVKILHADTDDAFRRRFADEARRVAAIAHPNVVTVYDAVADGTAFIVMELVPGRTLDELVGERGPLHPREVSRIVSQIGAALDAAHERGIVHCDVKPSNVIVTDRGTAKLTDFGIARAARDAPERDLVGTPRYVAPELVEGRAPSKRSDVYSLGLLAYELLAGAPAYRASDTQQLLRDRLGAPAPRLRAARPGVSARLDSVVARALERDPVRRYATAGELAEAVAASVDAAPTVVIAAPSGRRVTGAPLFDRRSVLALLAVLLIGAGLLLFFREFGAASMPTPLDNVRGLTFDQAKEKLNRQGLDVRREDDRTQLDKFGIVIDQRPAPNSQVRRGDKVTLVVAARPRTANVVGKNLEEAANILVGQGFAQRVRWEVDRNARGEPQTVVRQDPPAGAEFTLGQQATVYIVGPRDANEED